MAFYSAVEEQADLAPKAKAKQQTKAKRLTTAALCSDGPAPQIGKQLAALQKGQQDLEARLPVSMELAQLGPSATSQMRFPSVQPKPPHQQPFQLSGLGKGFSVSPQANLIGPPPRTREPLDLGAGVPLQDEPAERGYGMPPESAEFPSMQAAIMQQTQALSVLMSHVLSQADGGLADLASGSGSSSSLASRGAAKRERLQQALSSRTGNFFLQVMQQVSRRLNPASAAPQSLAELQGSPMMCRYLERFGGYAGQREAGYLMWMLAPLDHQPDTWFTTKVSFATWAGGLLRGVFCSRTTFASFLKSTLHLNRLVPDKPSCRAAGLVFPLPVPSPGAFEPFPLGLSSRTRRRILHRRLLHVVVMALNFLHNDFVPIPLALLQRPPTQVQVRLTSSVGRLLKAFGASVGEELLVSTGRRNPQLVARLSELISLLTTISPKGYDARKVRRYRLIRLCFPNSSLTGPFVLQG